MKELYFHFTGVTIGFYHLDGDIRPWRHVESTKQGEFLFLCIHFATMDPLLTTGSIHTQGIWKYRPRGTISTGFVIADGVAINGNGTPDPQNKVSSGYRVYILQAWTRYLPFD
jgi:hypothetical protein